MLDGLIVKGVGGLYTVDTADGVFMCRPRGIFRKDKISPLVGDKVSIEPMPDGEGVIETIHERSSLLMRPKAANISLALLVFACKEPDLHLDLLDRFIINCEASGVEIVICFNKTDLLNDAERADFLRLKGIYDKAGYRTLAVSAETGEGILEISEILKGHVSVLAGPSGAGKSSIFNIISDSVLMETGDLSQKIKRGKHTTRHTQLIKLSLGGYVADTPGFSSVYFDGVNRENLRDLFREFREYEDLCQFANCNHMDEPDCAVKTAVADGGIDSARYGRYIGFFRELEE